MVSITSYRQPMGLLLLTVWILGLVPVDNSKQQSTLHIHLDKKNYQLTIMPLVNCIVFGLSVCVLVVVTTVVRL